MKKRMTPLGALLGTAALNMIASDTHRGAVKLPQPTFAAPGTAGPSYGIADRRTHQPADVLGGASCGKTDGLMVDAGDTGHAKTDTAAVRGLDTDAATGGVDTNTKQSS